MNQTDDYISINKALWNEKTKFHVDSEFYNMPAFLAGASTLHDIELNLLGNISGKTVLHLQCHFGQDSLSLTRLGARVTGVDLSDEAITRATALAASLQLDAEFICCNIYDLPEFLDKQFDIVFTSYGTIGWLQDLERWAKIINRFLKPGGEFVFAEFHPVIWMFDNDIKQIEYSYFNKEAIVETEQGTYADKSAPIALQSISFNHSLAEVIQSLINAGLTLSTIQEFDYSPYDVFPGMEEIEKNKFRIAAFKDKVPLVYALKAVKQLRRSS